jgi:hypothetical protein
MARSLTLDRFGRFYRELRRRKVIRVAASRGFLDRLREDSAGAERELRRALELKPDYSTARSRNAAAAAVRRAVEDGWRTRWQARRDPALSGLRERKMLNV